jgi:hypothetical protein
MTGNFLDDIFGDSISVDKINRLINYFTNSKKLPLLDFVNQEMGSNPIFVKDSFGDIKTIKSIYNEIGYPLNRGPIYYVSNYLLNYSFETYIIVTQDGMICQNPSSNKEVAFFAWDSWKEILYTKHKDLEAPVILLAYPENNETIELSISPKLDMAKNVKLGAKDGRHSASYTEIVHHEMNFAHTIFINLWKIVDANRNSDLNNIPLDSLTIYNDLNFFDSLIEN